MKSLSGAGSFSAAELCGVNSLSVSFDANGNFASCPSVAGSLEFDDTVALTVSVADTHRVQNGDYPVISACTLIITIMVLIASFMLDIIYAFIDPRVKAAQFD